MEMGNDEDDSAGQEGGARGSKRKLAAHCAEIFARSTRICASKLQENKEWSFHRQNIACFSPSVKNYETCNADADIHKTLKWPSSACHMGLLLYSILFLCLNYKCTVHTSGYPSWSFRHPRGLSIALCQFLLIQAASSQKKKSEFFVQTSQFLVLHSFNSYPSFH